MKTCCCVSVLAVIVLTLLLFFQMDSSSLQDDRRSIVLRRVNTSLIVTDVFPMILGESENPNRNEIAERERIVSMIKKRTGKDFKLHIYTLDGIDRDKIDVALSDKNAFALSVFEDGRNFYFFSFPVNTGDQENLSKEIDFEEFLTELTSKNFKMILAL